MTKSIFTINEGITKRTVKMACIASGVPLVELARKMKLSQSGLTNRLNTGRFTLEELQKMAVILGGEYVCYFEAEDGTRIMFPVRERLKDACAVKKVSLSELGRRIGLSQQGISQRVQNGKFTQEEQKKIAQILGYKYVSYFNLEGDAKIYFIE